MDKAALLALQNGSDVRGIAISTEKHEATFTADKVTRIGYGFVECLQKDLFIILYCDKKVKSAIGQDSRLS